MADPNTILSRNTSFSKLENGQRKTTYVVRSNMKLGDGVTNVEVLNPQGQVVESGTAADVASRLQQNPSGNEGNNEKIVAEIQKHDSNLQFARNQAIPRDTAGTTPTADASRVESPAAERVSNGNKPALGVGDPAPNVSVILPPPNQASGVAEVDLTQKTPPVEDKPAAQTPATAQAEKIIDKSGQLLGFNPLDDLSDYTYSFILSFLKPEQLNAIVQNPDTVAQYVKNNVIIASGSKNTPNLKRNPEFNYDFYITELKFDTIVGMNSRTKGSNALTLSFKIVEPLGVSFFDRLYEMSIQAGVNNYLEIPYLLVIEFRGNTDEGKPVVLTDHTKYIPIKLINASMQLNNSGSEYQIDAIPFSQVSYHATEHGSTPVNIRVQAGTVGEFFANSRQIDELANQITTDQRELKQTTDILRSTAATDIELGVTTEQQRAKEIDQRTTDFKKKVYNAKSYTQALNSFQLYLKINKVSQQLDEYIFDIHPDIINSKIVEPNLTSSGQTTPVPQQGFFSINAGTSIVDAINLAMFNSDYIKDQLKEHQAQIKNLKDPTEIANILKKPIKWYKIIPSVTIREYDFVRNTFARSITYHIVPYLVHNTKSPHFSKSLPTKWLHDYEYIFTGNNRSIIECNIRFDLMFFQLATANKEQWDKLNSSPGITVEPSPVSANAAAGQFAPIKTVPVSTNLSKTVSTGANTAMGIAVTDAYNHLLSNIRGDMIGISLKIIGDPRYIKQDEVFYNPKNSPTLELLSKNNSVVFDFEERYIRLIFNTPVDYGDNGLLATDEKYKTSRFSGIYRILRIENSFFRGKFEQTLDLIRLFDQENLQKPNENPRRDSSTTASDRRADNTTQSETVAQPPTPVTESGQPGIKTAGSSSILTGALPTQPTSQPITNGTIANPPQLAQAQVTDQDKLEATRIQQKAKDPDAITPQQVANNRTLNERLTRAFGFNPGGTVQPPSKEDS